MVRLIQEVQVNNFLTCSTNKCLPFCVPVYDRVDDLSRCKSVAAMCLEQFSSDLFGKVVELCLFSSFCFIVVFFV